MNNTKYWNADFLGQDLSGEPVEDFNNTTIKNCCFAQEWKEGDATVMKDIFPNGMTGVTFVDCNLDGCIVPVGNTVQGGTNRSIKVQNDLEDWVLDGDTPTEPTNKADFLALGLSIDPADIPNEKVDKPITNQEV
jgi:hypothetical protein